MHTYGFHLLLDVWLANEIPNDLVHRLKEYVRSRFTVVAEVEKAFEPWGITSVLVLSESHFTVHTYPEHNYLSMDLYICQHGIDLHKVRDELLSLMTVHRYQYSCHLRGHIPPAEIVKENTV